MSNLSSHRIEDWLSTNGMPIFSFTRQAIQLADRTAIDEYGLTGMIMMENAARNAVEEILVWVDDETEDIPIPLILCGKGNNGGDGLAMARHLFNEGLDPIVVLAFDPKTDTMTEEVRTHLQIVHKMGIQIEQVSAPDPRSAMDQLVQNLDDPEQPDSESPSLLIVDCLLGVGPTKPPRQPIDDIISWVNSYRKSHPATGVVAIDVPTGLDCDSGKPFANDAVRADLTITFVGLKEGYLTDAAQEYLGDLAIAETGLPIALIDRFGQFVGPDELFE